MKTSFFKMSLQQNVSTPKFGTPTSADACMSIVHSLMCYRQGAGERGESEQVPHFLALV